MNAVERGMRSLIGHIILHVSHPDCFAVVHYVRLEGGVPQEAAYEKPDVKPPSEWPTQGAVEFKDVRMCYRPGLPEVLKGINLSVRGGEKIGVVGRYAISLFLLSGVID